MVATVLCVLRAGEVLASTQAGLPWEAPLVTIRDSMSGPVAGAIALLGIVVCGGMLIWGGEISEFTRRIVMVVLVVALLVGANTLLTTLFQVSGAVI
jgi:type IV secretion system protein VirB2